MPKTELKNVIDIFCGAGGLSAGFSKAGYNIITGIDNNKNSIETFRANHDCEPIVGDIQRKDAISNIKDSVSQNGYNIENVDLVIGGPPCRGFSMANVRSDSAEHPLNELPARFLEIVQEINPEAVLIENVPRLLTIADGKFKESIIARLEAMGYRTTHGVLEAEKFGVPQKRRRVFFIGHKSTEPELPTQGEFKFQMPVTVKQAISDLPELPTGGGGEMKMEYSSNNSKISEYVAKMRRNEKNDIVMNHRTTRNQEKTYRRFKHIPQGGNWRDIPEDLMKNYTNRQQTHDHIYQRLDEDEPAKTVANFRKQMIVHPTQNRLLSVREAARLQSFPDDYHFKGSSFNARQQMVGDAVPVNLAYSIGKSLQNSHTTSEISSA
jgi:DNA (cytosine-5)-methyltransferase 1